LPKKQFINLAYNFQSKNILITPLHWGLGHATRCVPIINLLIKHNFNVIIASDGAALDLLKKEFPNLSFLTLPSYQIEYPKNGKNFRWRLLKNSLKIVKAIYNEHKIIDSWVEKYNLCGIISDNRLGCFSNKIPSVYITHQLTVLSGKTTWFSTKLHQFFIKKYTECWIPDVADIVNLSGKMGHSKMKKQPKYIGVLSRFSKKETVIENQLLVLLSGPEPQRTVLEKIILNELQNYPEKTLLIQGKIAENQKIEKPNNNLTIYNFMTSTELENAINASELILCRSGYSSIMDLSVLEKKAFFIPTPGQFEQEYLAKKMKQQGFANYSKQDNFSITDLKTTTQFQGIPNLKQNVDWEELFTLF